MTGHQPAFLELRTCGEMKRTERNQDISQDCEQKGAEWGRALQPGAGGGLGA